MLHANALFSASQQPFILKSLFLIICISFFVTWLMKTGGMASIKAITRCNNTAKISLLLLC